MRSVRGLGICALVVTHAVYETMTKEIESAIELAGELQLLVTKYEILRYKCENKQCFFYQAGEVERRLNEARNFATGLVNDMTQAWQNEEKEKQRR